jgi:hypothetical protein
VRAARTVRFGEQDRRTEALWPPQPDHQIVIMPQPLRCSSHDV